MDPELSARPSPGPADAHPARLADELGNGRFVRSLLEKAGRTRDVRIMALGAEPSPDELVTLEAAEPVIVNADPTPGWLSTLTSPPITAYWRCHSPPFFWMRTANVTSLSMIGKNGRSPRGPGTLPTRARSQANGLPLWRR